MQDSLGTLGFSAEADLNISLVVLLLFLYSHPPYMSYNRSFESF